MEPTTDPPPELDNGGDQQRCNMKLKIDDESVELKRVAEIVLVLSTMATMRGGKKPTDVEVELMREARSKLAVLCQGIAPKDIVGGEAIGSVIQDLGLNAKAEEKRLGFRMPNKMSIAERFSFAKSKMEEAKKFSAPTSTTYTSQPLQTNTNGMVDNRVPSNAARMFTSDKSNNTAISSTVSMMSIPPHLSAGSSAALQYQSTSNEVRPPIVSGVMPNNHMGRNPSSVVLPKVENPQFKVTAGLSGAPYVLQVQANSLANQSLSNAPTWSIQTQPVSLARNVSENKVPPAHNSVKVEVTGGATLPRAGPQVTTAQNVRPFITQMGPGKMSSIHQPLQGGNMVQPPLIPSHSDIAKVVQKLLLPKVPEHPTWTAPSRDYMSKTFTCQACELTVSEVDSVLICDACERGFHLKCLQPSVIKGIHNRVDWHCMKCLSLSGGKPLPPKYGRVMRSSVTSPSFPSNTAGIQPPSSEKKAENLDSKVSPQMVTTNGNSVPTVSSANHNTEPSFDSNTPDTIDIQGSNISSRIETIDEKTDPNICMKSAACSASTGLQGESCAEQIDSKALTCKDTSELTCKNTSESETLPKLSEPVKCENLQSSQGSQIEMAVSQDKADISSDRHVSSSFTISNQKDSQGGENITYDINHNDLDVAQPNSVGGSGTNTEGIQHSGLSSDNSHAVEWIADVVQLVVEKKYYQSCCIDGVTYRLQGHAFFTSNHGKLTPSKLQSMWEDSKTGVKWVKVTKCYFPDDLPGNIGHPCISEVNESSHLDGKQIRTKPFMESSEKLIPKKYVKKYWKEISNPIFLRFPNGVQQEIFWVKSNGDILFQRNWNPFAKSLKCGYILTFKYTGGSFFKVKIFGVNALEINYSNVKSVSEEVIEVSDESSDNQSEDEWENESTDNESEDEWENESTDNMDLENTEQTFSGVNNNNPSFYLTLTPTYAQGYFFRIPNDFSREYMNGFEGIALLMVGDHEDRTWQVNVQYDFVNKNYIMNKGWKIFAQENNLQIDNVCKFEMTRYEPLSFTVTIIQAREKPTPKTFKIVVSYAYPCIPKDVLSGDGIGECHGKFAELKVDGESWSVKLCYHNSGYTSRFYKGWSKFKKD